MAKVFIFDTDKCNGCFNCQIVCKDEHVDNEWEGYAKPQPDTGQFWIQVHEQVRGSVPKVRVNYHVTMCQHCDNAPCIAAAPEAAYTREDGLVIIDPDKATGKRELVEACPYGAVFYNAALDLPQKCTGCAHLLDDGWEVPRCVDACATDALLFGEEADFEDLIARSELCCDERASDKPRVYYLNKPKRFIAGVVVDMEADEVLIGASLTLEDTVSGEVLTGTSDDFGDFWFKQIAASSYRLYVEAEGYLTRVVDVDTRNKDANTGPIDLYAAPQY